jgi:hypothetical protein
VGRYADAHVGRAVVPSAERVDVGERDVQARIGEASLCSLRRLASGSPGVDYAKQRDAQADVARSGNHGIGQDGAVGVGHAAGLVMHVVELPHRAHPAAIELAVGDAGDREDRLRGELVGETVHRRAPRPEIIDARRSRPLGVAAESALEGVGMRRGKGRER